MDSLLSLYLYTTIIDGSLPVNISFIYIYYYSLLHSMCISIYIYFTSCLTITVYIFISAISMYHYCTPAFDSPIFIFYFNLLYFIFYKLYSIPIF